MPHSTCAKCLPRHVLTCICPMVSSDCLVSTSSRSVTTTINANHKQSQPFLKHEYSNIKGTTSFPSYFQNNFKYFKIFYIRSHKCSARDPIGKEIWPMTWVA